MSPNKGRGRSSSPRPRPWSAADSDKCECVLEVMPDDVLLGRGSGPNDHVGNIKFRDLVHERKSEYLSTNHRQTKAMIAKDIVDQVYARGGRFLKKLSPVESAKILPKLLNKNSMDESENDRTDVDNPGPCDVYQIQKHATVMEKAKQALRQNQRNGSPDLPENRSLSPNKESASARRDSLGRANNNNNNWNAMGMGNIPTTLNNSNHNGRQFHGNNMRDTFDMPNPNFSPSSPQAQNQDSYQQQMYQQQQDLINLQKQHDLLQQQMQYQQRQQQNQQQQLEMETHNQLLQEQLELQIRQEQLRQLQQQTMQKLANNAAKYSMHQQDSNDQQFRRPDQTVSHTPNSPPAVLNGYATYTTTLDAMEGSRHTANDGLADPHDAMLKADVASLGNSTDPGKFHPDDKSMQLSTMMGSFKDMSVKSGEDHTMQGSVDTIGTIENIPAGLSISHMSGVSMMSMMNDSTDSLFKNQQKPNEVGGKNASWASASGNNSGHGPLVDVIETANPAAVAAAAVLGRPVPGFDKAQRRWSGGYVPDNEVPIQRRFNRRGSLQYNSSNNSSDLAQMQSTATAMLAMAAAEHNQQLQQQEQQAQNFNYTGSPSGLQNTYGAQDMMNSSNHQYHMDNGGYGMNVPFNN